ncbi:MAG: HEAT repeat domain-containing protein [Dissulfurispiraceae bacterium]|jgi:HEAT repeat protein|nr:HEAT repeat domain-containing protein [Dissulfurispiraceae bacterium]
MRISFFVLKLFLAVSVFFVFYAEQLCADMRGIDRALESKDEQIQFAAIDQLGRTGSEKAVDKLIDIVYSREHHWTLKIRAMTHLGSIGNAKAIDPLMEMLTLPLHNFDCPSLLSYAARALGHFNKEQRVVDILIQEINYDNLQVREAIIDALGMIGSKRAVSILIPLLNDRNFAIRVSTIKALGNIGDPKALAPLQSVLNSNDDRIIIEYAKNAINVIKK